MISKVIRRCFVSIILTIFIISIGVLLTLSSLRIERDAVFIIEKNVSTRLISQQLAEKKIIYNQVAFFIFAKFYSKVYSRPIMAGEYNLKTGLDIIDLMRILTGGKVIQHSLAIPQGFTIKQVLQKISSRDNIKDSSDNLKDISEGSIMPDTYFYTYNILDIELIKRMQSAMTSFISIEWEKRDKSIDNFICSSEEAIILASIVEKETYIDSEKPMIAGVYINRLKKGMKLQACPTVIYGLNLIDNPNWDKRLRYSHLKSQSEYNTYINRGLPPKPICNPGKKSILAVLHPKWSEKLFFVSKGAGKHLFASSFEQHQANIRKVNE